MIEPLTNDYFPNHKSPDRFPFSLYHGPIRSLTMRAFQTALKHQAGSTVLNVGCGFSHILDRMPPGIRYLGCDVDERTIAYCRARFTDRGASFEVSQPYRVPFPDGVADFAISTEVIEHVEDPNRWLSEIARVLKPGAIVCLSTPNYGGWLFPFLERTFLEWIARRNGFTRKGIHPMPYSGTSLQAILSSSGFENIQIKKTPGNLALVATARKPF